MGEYVFIDGVQQKLGTCEDLFYMDFVTYVDLLTARRVAHCPGNAQPLGYIEPGAQASRFRFLWPWQNDRNDYDYAYTVAAPPGFLLGDWEHSKVTVTVFPQGQRSAPHWNIFSPCPNGPDWDKDRLFPTDYVQVTAQKPMPGAGDAIDLWTVVRCPWCGALARLDLEHAAALVADWSEATQPLADRIMAGYAPIEGEPHRDQAGGLLWARWQAAKLLGID